MSRLHKMMALALAAGALASCARSGVEQPNPPPAATEAEDNDAIVETSTRIPSPGLRAVPAPEASDAAPATASQESPPASPPSAAPAAESADAAIAVTGTRIARSRVPSPKGRTETARTEPGTARWRSRTPGPEAQAGLLTAGDHDDLLNPQLYADYAGRFLQQNGANLPFVDTRTRVAVKLIDARGRPVPLARVTVARAGVPLQLVSTADGIVSFYPRFDHVPARTTLQVVSAAGNASRALDLGGAGGRWIRMALPGTAPAVSALDLALVVDTTGSMGDEMAYLQTELDAIVARLKREAGNLDLRIGLIVYRDTGDAYVVRSTPLTGDIGELRAILARQEATGGGDMPEAVDQAFAAAERLQWRPGAAKAMLFVADAPPHDERIAPTLASTERLRTRGVRIVPVAASGVDDTAQYVMRMMAALTQTRYIFLTDDSGVGNPHAEPDVDCYLVTHLDNLIARVLAGIVQGRRIEPREDEVIRAIGDYDRGRCRRAGWGSFQDRGRPIPVRAAPSMPG